MSEEILLKAEDVKQYFTVKKAKGKKATLKAVDGISIDIYKGETFGLVGESGCGKSTLGKVFLRLYPLTGGRIEFHGEDISHHKGKALKDFRMKTQMIFQDPSSCLNPRRKIKDILTEPYVIHKMYDKAEREHKAKELCDMVGLSRIYLDRYPHEMSGGQKQRVGIARAIALKPELIVCDEPVSALDVSIQAQTLNLLHDLQQELGLTYLFISHDLGVVHYISDRVCVMFLGKICEIGTTAEVYNHPRHPYTKYLLAATPRISAHADRKDKELLTGEIPSPINPPSGCRFRTRCPYAQERCAQEVPALQDDGTGHVCACHFPLA